MWDSSGDPFSHNNNRLKYQDISKNQAALMLAGIRLSNFWGGTELAVSMLKLA